MDNDDIKKKWGNAGIIPTSNLPTPYKWPRIDNSHITIDEYRTVKAGTRVWSIANQAMIMIQRDTIIQIKQKVYNDTIVFVKPMQIIGELMFPSLIGLGKDEWSLDYSNTESYTLPPPGPFVIDFKYE